LRYWLSAISFSFQDAVANSIMQRSLIVNSRQLHQCHYKDKSNWHIHASDRIDGSYPFRHTTFNSPAQSSSSDNANSFSNHGNFAANNHNSLLLPAPPFTPYQDSSGVVVDMQNDFQSLTIYEDPNLIASNYYISSSPSPLFYPPNTYLPHMLSQPITQSFTPITLPSQPFVTQSVLLSPSTSQSVFNS